MSSWSWTPVEGGYRATDGRASLAKVAGTKKWVLSLRDGRQFPLPRRASFDHAEQILARELGGAA